MGNSLDLLRVTVDSQRSLLAATGWGSAGITVVIPYLIAGISRYSFFSVLQPLQLARIVFIGVLGWGLVTITVRVGSTVLGGDPSWTEAAFLVAQAHLALATASVAIYVLSFLLQAFTLSRLVAVAAAALWFPAALIAATAVAAATGWRRAVLPGLAAATVWWVLVGVPLIRLIGHLL